MISVKGLPVGFNGLAKSKFPGSESCATHCKAALRFDHQRLLFLTVWASMLITIDNSAKQLIFLTFPLLFPVFKNILQYQPGRFALFFAYGRLNDIYKFT